MRQDLRFALRSLLRSPGFLLTAVGSLAIALGHSVAHAGATDVRRAVRVDPSIVLKAGDA